MRTVNVADLKNNLSKYLREVRRGEEVLVRDRNTPIAKIVPLAEAGDWDQELLRLAAAGVLKLPKRKLNVRAFLARRGPRISLDKAVAAVVADRDED